MIHPRYAREKGAVERYLAEARKAGELDQPNLPRVFATGTDPGGAPLVVREFLDGVCLQRYLRDKGALSPEVACFIVHGILGALGAVHDVGLSNGDLTADDVFLTRGPDGETVVKVLDFGEAPLKQALVAHGTIPPTSRYWAPEHVRSGIVNERGDIFAAGALLYQTVSGRLPYPDGIPAAPQVIPIPPNPSSLVPGVNRKIDIVVRRAMALLPNDRYRTAAMFAEAVKPFLPSRPFLFDY
jgi:serine/threonine-protein kinase